MDKVLYAGEWLKVIERDGWYHFSQFTDSGGVVYILVYDLTRPKPILGRYEVCPAHGDVEPTLTSITGGINIKRRPIDVAVEEIHEEAGYVVAADQITDLGKVMIVKWSDNIAHLYSINAAGLKRGKAPGDGSQGEIGSYCDWISLKEAMNCKCPVFSTLLVRSGKFERWWDLK